MKEKVIVLIIAHKELLSDAEKASLLQCHSVLQKYPIRFIVPSGLNVNAYKELLPKAKFEFIDPKWQASYRMFNRLKIDPFLYEKFNGYEFILFYEPDAWVFRDELEQWCKKNYDYIGAPWISNVIDGIPEFSPIGGNGGFSLRNVASHLNVLKKWKIRMGPSEIWNYHKQFHKGPALFLRLPMIILRMLGFQNNSVHFMRTTALNEDVFWCEEAPRVIPGFKVAPPAEAIPFSFETHPSVLFKMNEDKLPFGCHAWQKYEPDFWSKYIPSK